MFFKEHNTIWSCNAPPHAQGDDSSSTKYYQPNIDSITESYPNLTLKTDAHRKKCEKVDSFKRKWLIIKDCYHYMMKTFDYTDMESIQLFNLVDSSYFV